MDNNAVIQIVDEIALHPVKYFYFTVGFMPGIREGLHHAVISNRYGGMSPLNSPLDGTLGVGQCIHAGHLSMEMQLHTLLRRSIFSIFMGYSHDVDRRDLNITSIPGQLHMSLQPQPHTRRDGFFHLLGLFLSHVLTNGDGAVVIRHLQIHAPLPGPAGLIYLQGKNLALQYHVSHFGVQSLHGDRLAADLLSEDHLAVIAGIILFSSMSVGRMDGQPQLP